MLNLMKIKSLGERKWVVSGVPIIALSACLTLSNAILTADDQAAMAWLLADGIRVFASAAIMGIAGVALWWWASEQPMGKARSLTALCAVSMTVGGGITVADGLIGAAKIAQIVAANPGILG